MQEKQRRWPLPRLGQPVQRNFLRERLKDLFEIPAGYIRRASKSAVIRPDFIDAGRKPGSETKIMSFVGAVAAPHSHLPLFTRPAENEDYRAKVARGRKALGVLREQVEKSGADTMLIIHDDHFVNFDFRCYPPFCLLIGKQATGSGVVDPAEIERITGAVYKKYQGKTSYRSRPSECRSTSRTGKAATSPTLTGSTRS